MNLNIANQITLLRIALIPVFMFFLLVDPIGSGEYIAVAIFIAAAITDAIDGYLARKRDLVTNFGKFADPVADKLLIAAALVSLIDLGQISAWPVIIILAREFAITGLRVLAAAQGIVIAASNLGKYKTNAQIFAIIFLVLGRATPAVPELIGVILLWVAVALTVISGADYMINSREVITDED
ncbi:MAG: CDP-diacylglycerol--glycerol-3-phosphate 3-phosphatidyltransferase [Halanaerobacter sp.]